jgi:hypothetical protein
VSEPTSGVKNNKMNFNERKFSESRDNVAFEESIVSGTKIELPGQKKHLNKKNIEVDEKRQKIDEIQKKYDKTTKKKDQKRMTRGYSYQEPGTSKAGKLVKGNATKHQKDEFNDITDVTVQASKITAQKREKLNQKKGGEMVADKKTTFKPKRSMEDHLIDEKLNTQIFRFTNQFKSEMDGDVDYSSTDKIDHNDMYDEEIAEEIESRSNDSPRGPSKHMNLKKKIGPMEIPSDSNPFKRDNRRHEESSGQIGTPINRPPKVPNRLNSKTVFQSPANQIFITKRQRQQMEEEKNESEDLPDLIKRHSEPAKPITVLAQSRVKGNIYKFIQYRSE